jgi:prepilin-type N-terminal cleavage/methylation domain-containing protein
MKPLRTYSGRRCASQRGMTILEIMIVLAIVAGASLLVRSGFRLITKADLSESSVELTALMRSAGELASSKGEMRRVVIDLDKHAFAVEVCKGSSTVVRNDTVVVDEQSQKRAMERAKDRMRDLPADALSTGDPEMAAKRATALAGQHIADRMCAPETEGISGDADGKAWIRSLPSGKGIKFRKVYVAHREEPQTSGQVAIYFFPTGSAEKAVVEITDGTDVYSVLVFGLTGRIELHDGVIEDIESHMLRNPKGDKDKAREERR